MARTTSDEELQLKKRARRRLVGAVVLATTVAVVLPMVLDTEPKPVSHNVNIQIPSPDAPAVKSGLGAPSPAGREGSDVKAAKSAAPELQVAQPAASETPAPSSAKPETAPAERPEPAPGSAPAPKAAESPAAATAKAADAAAPAAAGTAKPEAKEAKTASPDPKAATKPAEAPKAAAGGKYVVQVAALADSAKAKQLQQQMAGAGVRAYTEVVKTSKGDVTRVRAGPYDTREAAEKARGRLKSAGLDGKVVPR